ncbi:MAG: hypothetical protein PVJ36_08945 [Nitrospirota bacterium]
MRLITASLCLLFALLSSGCAMKNPVAVWQGSLDEYIAEQGAGDPNVLRDAVDMHSRSRLRPASITFGGEFKGPGMPGFRANRYVNGVLLGQRDFDSRPWYFFLVGVRSRDGAEIEDIRLAAFTPEEDGLLWRLAPPDPEALERYVSATEGGSLSVTFPSPLDRYSLGLSGHVATAAEERSGAAWELDLRD